MIILIKQLRMLGSMLLLLAVSAGASAQNRTVSGKITDEGGEAIPGASITVKGKKITTVSQADGVYAIQLPGGSNTLIFSYVGYATQEVQVSGSDLVNITLQKDAQQLENVIVTALGIERNARSLQFSATKVGGDNFTQARENSVVNGLAGRVAGVNVSKIASGPNGSTRIVIRGAKTLGANLNQPLYVIDGVPMDNSNGGQAGIWGGADEGDGMSSINPDDIASMTVLKGAGAAALYGSRAANGVILITTKRGSAQKGLGVEFNSNYISVLML